MEENKELDSFLSDIHKPTERPKVTKPTKDFNEYVKLYTETTGCLTKRVPKDGEFSKFTKGYYWIFELKCDSTLKILLMFMFDNSNVNKGFVHWKYKTYADRMGMCRHQIQRWFKKLIANGSLIPHPNNHAGSPQNKFVIDIQQLNKNYAN